MLRHYQKQNQLMLKPRLLAVEDTAMGTRNIFLFGVVEKLAASVDF